MGGPSAAAGVDIRGTQPHDLDALVSIALACGRERREWAREHWSPPALAVERRLWWERLREPDGWVAVAVAGLTRVGSVGVSQGRAERRHGAPGGHLAYLLGPFVDPDWWGLEIGTRLHEEALAVMGRLGYRRAEALVEAGNRRGRRFLERHGWERLEGWPQRSALALVPYGRPVPSANRARFRKRAPARRGAAR